MSAPLWRWRVVALLTLLLVGAVPAQAAEAAPAPYFSIPYERTLLFYESENASVRTVSYDSWSRAGFPAPIPAPTTLVKLSWSDDIYAVSTFGSTSFWDRLELTQWAAAGYPPFSSGASISGSLNVLKYTTSDELFLVVEPARTFHKLTPAEWVALGNPEPRLSATGVMNLSWAPTGIALVTVSRSFYRSDALDYGSWAELDFPSPRSAPSLPGDYLCLRDDGVTFNYIGATYNSSLTPAQWAATGYMPDECHS